MSAQNVDKQMINVRIIIIVVVVVVVISLHHESTHWNVPIHTTFISHHRPTSSFYDQYFIDVSVTDIKISKQLSALTWCETVRISVFIMVLCTLARACVCVCICVRASVRARARVCVCFLFTVLKKMSLCNGQAGWWTDGLVVGLLWHVLSPRYVYPARLVTPARFVTRYVQPARLVTPTRFVTPVRSTGTFSHPDTFCHPGTFNRNV